MISSRTCSSTRRPSSSRRNARSAAVRGGLRRGLRHGAAGPAARDSVGRLVGADLSQNMVDKARELGCYDVGGRRPVGRGAYDEAFDLIAAAVVLLFREPRGDSKVAAARAGGDRPVRARRATRSSAPGPLAPVDYVRRRPRAGLFGCDSRGRRSRVENGNDVRGRCAS